MKTFNMKTQAYQSLRYVVGVTNHIPFRKLTDHIPLRKMKTPFYLSLMGMVALTGTSFKKAKSYSLRTATKYSYKVIIIKNKYEMQIYDSSGEWLVTYPVVFGNKDLGDKMMEGDRKTPEGIFHIGMKRKHEKWNSFLSLDYPTAESYQRFNQRKAKGLIPANARIGGSIGIHGTWPHEEFAVDTYQNWTEGCISTKNDFIQEIFSMLPVGTTVEIRR
ncbi:MAG: L,D-transpeptidase [Sediminibacterium sp.]